MMAGLITRRLLLFKVTKLKKRSLFLHDNYVSRINFYSSDNAFSKENRKFSLTEREINLNSDPNTFGTLTPGFEIRKRLNSSPPEVGDKIVRNFYDAKTGKKRLSTKKYADLIKNYLSQKRLVDALDILEVKMLKEDHAMPENYIYNLLIDGCAKAGYTKKAFQLYNQMKKRGLKVTGATYTSLFNGCALSPIPGDGLTRAKHLRDLIIEKGVILNQTNYHAMIKAFGHCGDIQTAFLLVDEMILKEIPVSSDTYCFLLQACISDKDTGFKYALLLWQKMREKDVKPTLFCFNLMLRCTRDCGIGEMDSLDSVLQISSKINDKMVEGEEPKLLGESNNNNDDDDRGLGCCIPVNNEEVKNVGLMPPVAPNLLSGSPHLGTVVSVKSIEKPKHRIMLLGGGCGFLEQMSKDNVKPDIKTFILMLSIIPSTSIAEKELINAMNSFGVKVDIDFCNALIHKRVKRSEFSSAKEVLCLISKAHLQPNIMTFGVLALACRTTKEAHQLLINLDEAGFRINMEIAGGLLCAARHSWNISTMLQLLEIVSQEQIRPSKRFIEQIEKFRSFVQKQFQLKDNGLEYHQKIDEERFQNMYHKFNLRYSMWSKYIELDESDKQHPWKQFKKESTKTN